MNFKLLGAFAIILWAVSHVSGNEGSPKDSISKEDPSNGSIITSSEPNITSTTTPPITTSSTATPPITTPLTATPPITPPPTATSPKATTPSTIDSAISESENGSKGTDSVGETEEYGTTDPDTVSETSESATEVAYEDGLFDDRSGAERFNYDILETLTITLCSSLLYAIRN